MNAHTKNSLFIFIIISTILFVFHLKKKKNDTKLS